MTTSVRYSRATAVEWIGAQGLNELQSSTVAVFGVGNLGGEAARHMAMLGVNLLLVDRDIVQPENLGTQGFLEDHLGLAKAEARARLLTRLNSGCRLQTIVADIQRLGMGFSGT